MRLTEPPNEPELYSQTSKLSPEFKLTQRSALRAEGQGGGGNVPHCEPKVKGGNT